jgi:RimJ/RimL family protein N-acetyltransferase
MAYGWEGNKTRLVPLQKDRHLENAVLWLNDPDVTQWVLVGDFPITKMAEQAYFDDAEKQRTDQVSFAIETLAGEHIGFSGVHEINFRHGCATTGTIIGRKDLWGQGLGTDAARTRARYCFDVLGLRLLLSAYFAENDGSRLMQERVGYKEYGRIPKRFWNRGKLCDEVLTYLDRETWEALNLS